MKKIIIIVFFLIFVFQSCNNEDEIVIPRQEINQTEPLSYSKSGSHPCSSTITGAYSPKWGNHYYSTEILTTSCTEAGGTITITVNASVSPNTFQILDGNGNTLAYSGWLGYSALPGPWGSSLNGPSTKTYTFPKTTQTYQLKVFTITQGWGDTWSANFSCQNICADPPNCNSDCGTNVSDSYNNSNGGFYIYPDKIISVCDIPFGGTISITLNALKTPNAFFILDGNGNSIIATNWLGYSTQSGPWGSSISGPASQTFSFTKVTETYKIRAWTSTQGWTDNWSADIACQ